MKMRAWMKVAKKAVTEVLLLKRRGRSDDPVTVSGESLVPSVLLPECSKCLKAAAPLSGVS
jgi:hypothetical protein